MEAVAEVLAAIQGKKWSGANIVISHSCQQRRCSMGGAQGIPTSTKMECEDLLTFSLSAGSSFTLVEHFRRGCNQSNQWQVR
jgi:hypothetical protein